MQFLLQIFVTKTKKPARKVALLKGLRTSIGCVPSLSLSEFRNPESCSKLTWGSKSASLVVTGNKHVKMRWDFI